MLVTLADQLKRFFILSFYNDRVKEELYKHIYQVEYQDYILDFIYEVYYQLKVGAYEITKGYYNVVEEFTNASKLNDVIKAEYLSGKDLSKDNILNTLLFLRMNITSLDNAILVRVNIEEKNKRKDRKWL